MRETIKEILTHPLELLLEFGHVLALCDPEVVVRVVRLVHTVGRRRRPNRQHRCRARRALCLPHLLHCHSRASHRLRRLFLSTLYQRQLAASYFDTSVAGRLTRSSERDRELAATASERCGG